MPWGKMDDKFHRNEKVRKLRKQRGGREALGVWVFWWSWCLDDPELTGCIPSGELSREDERSALLLVDVGLWDKTDAGYQFHDFNEYNPTREQVEARREADRLRQEEKRKRDKGRESRRDNGVSHTGNQGDVASTRDPVPSRPDPSQERESLARPAHEDRVEEAPDGQTAHGWLWDFGQRWAARRGRIAYGYPGDSKACGELAAVLARWTPEQRAEAWGRRAEMFEAFVAGADRKTQEADFRFAFFVNRFTGLAFPDTSPPVQRRDIRSGPIRAESQVHAHDGEVKI